jgi:hypothetical protein
LQIVKQTIDEWLTDIADCETDALRAFRRTDMSDFETNHSGGLTLHIVRQTQRRPDFADCQTDTMEARHCTFLDRHSGDRCTGGGGSGALGDRTCQILRQNTAEARQ